MTDIGFPKFIFDKKISTLDNGKNLGEEYKVAIHELADIRRKLMLKKSPNLESKIEELSLLQWEQTCSYHPELRDELEGTRIGADLSVSEMVILNNYTDFRDIELPDEGCSVVGISGNSEINLGQTWDMHGSAKNYLMLIEHEVEGKKICTMTVCGCPALMGVNSDGFFIGVNNINTKKASMGVMWPAFVKRMLIADSWKERKDILEKTKLVSGHNYIMGDSKRALQAEKSPNGTEILSIIKKEEDGKFFHTNHCLGELHKSLEDKESLSSTTMARYKILSERVEGLKSFDDLFNLFQDHEGYPKSICSHFQLSGIDPSSTCGGGVFNPEEKRLKVWRGCPEYDKEIYKEHDFNLTMD